MWQRAINGASGGGTPNLSLIYAQSQPQPVGANNFSYTFTDDYDYVEVVYFNGNGASVLSAITCSISSSDVTWVCQKQTVGGPSTAIGTVQLWIAQVKNVKSGDTISGRCDAPYYGALFIVGV